MFNLFLLVASPFALVSLGINLYFQSYVPALLNFFQAIVLVIGFRISYLQKGLPYRSSLLLVMAIIAFAAAFFYKNGSEYRLLIMMIAAVVLFDKTWQYVFFALMVSMIFVIVRMDDLPMADAPSGDMFAGILKILLPLFVFAMSLYYFKHIYFRNLLQLEKTNMDLIAATEAKEKILHTVAHDLRSPVNNISGISRILLADDQFTADQKELLTLILQAADNSSSLINHLLESNHARANTLSLKQYDLSSIITQCVSLLQVAAGEKNIQIITHFSPSPLMVNIDKHRIERVISNLVNNAIKFSTQKSEIYIETKQENTNVLISIRDQGVGIAENDQEKIFDMFTNARRKGTAGEMSYGMGLSISKQIVEEHKGSITMESIEGKGTSFFVRLPLHTQ